MPALIDALNKKIKTLGLANPVVGSGLVKMLHPDIQSMVLEELANTDRQPSPILAHQALVFMKAQYESGGQRLLIRDRKHNPIVGAEGWLASANVLEECSGEDRMILMNALGLAYPLRLALTQLFEEKKPDISKLSDVPKAPAVKTPSARIVRPKPPIAPKNPSTHAEHIVRTTAPIPPTAKPRTKKTDPVAATLAAEEREVSGPFSDASKLVTDALLMELGIIDADGTKTLSSDATIHRMQKTLLGIQSGELVGIKATEVQKLIGDLKTHFATKLIGERKKPSLDNDMKR